MRLSKTLDCEPGSGKIGETRVFAKELRVHLYVSPEPNFPGIAQSARATPTLLRDDEDKEREGGICEIGIRACHCGASGPKPG